MISVSGFELDITQAEILSRLLLRDMSFIFFFYIFFFIPKNSVLKSIPDF